MKLKNFIRNKYGIIFLALTCFAIFLGIIMAIKLRFNLDNVIINPENYLKNNLLFHILFFLIIFFFSFLLSGFIFGCTFYLFEIASFSVLFINLIKYMQIKGFFLGLSILFFKALYFMIILIISLFSYKLSKSILSKQKEIKDKYPTYIKKILIFSIIGILLEAFNSFLGFKIIIFINSNLLN